MTGSKKPEESSQRESFPAAFNSLIGQGTPSYPLSTQGFGDQLQSPMEDTLMGPTRDLNANRCQVGSLSEVDGMKFNGEWKRCHDQSTPAPV